MQFNDPHVHIMGSPANVMEATHLVRSELQPQCKVTLKMDVGWTHHSHIIGKGGNNIQAVVKRTGVSIHFPDGNKNSETHKCNQVSINSRGKDLTSLEEARGSVREQTPLIFTFMLPAAAEFIIPTVNANLLVHSIQSTYNVQVELKLLSESPPIIWGSVKGIEWDSSRVKEATLAVLQSLCGSLGCQMQVQIAVHISIQHHAYVLGHNSENVRNIMQRTATTIKFPDPNDLSIPALDRSKVIISGGVEGVYRAHQNIVGSLPLVLMFDLPTEQVVEDSEIHQVMQSLDVCILARKKHLDGRKSIIIKGFERNASRIYEAWRQLSKTTKGATRAKVPPTYFIHHDYPKPIVDYGSMDAHLVPPFAYPDYEEDCEIPSFVDMLIQAKEDCPRQTYNDTVEICPDRRAPGCEKSLKTAANDLYTKKLQAAKAMKEPITSEPRVPTSKWSGQGLSQSLMPSYMISQLQLEDNLPSKVKEWDKWDRDSTPADSSAGSGSIDLKMWQSFQPSTSYIDRLPAKNTSPTVDNDISSVLAKLHLDLYIDHFCTHDIDMKLFLTLTEDDLKDIGITSFGHRKKIMIAIKNLTADSFNSRKISTETAAYKFIAN